MKNMALIILTILFLVVLAPAGSVSTAQAASTTSVLGGGVAINEILVNPGGSSAEFDTDQNGTVEDRDEFFELYNLGSATIDISGWELWDSGTTKWFTFPGSADSGTTMLPAGAYAVVIVGVQIGGSLPTMTNPDSLAFDAGKGSAILRNGGDNVVLYDPGDDEYVQLTYDGDPPDDPTSTYTGFSPTAVRVSQVEDWGINEGGKSLTRYPSGDSNVVVHDSIPGAGNASPSAISIRKFQAASPIHRHPAAIPLLLLIIALIFFALARYLIRAGEGY